MDIYPARKNITLEFLKVTQSYPLHKMHFTHAAGHMEKQEMEVEWKLEMEMEIRQSH